MTQDELAAIRARADAATPGPWESTEQTSAYLDGTIIVSGNSEVGSAWQDADAAFIAAAITDIPALLDEVERLRTRDVHYEAEFKRIEAIAVKKANAVAPFEVFPPNENTTCPKCNAHPRLLCAADWQPELPAFYVCGCGYIGQIGVGQAIEQSA